MGVIVNPATSGGSMAGGGAVDLSPVLNLLQPAPVSIKYVHSMYYYPGWKDDPQAPFGPPWDHAWWWKDSYPERQPLLGWLDEGSQTIMDATIRDAVYGGVDNFVFNYYHHGDTNTPYLDHAIKNFVASPEEGLTFCIGFETQTTPKPVLTVANMNTIIDRWGELFQSKKYLKIKGKPVVYIIKLEDLHNVVLPIMGMTHAQFLSYVKKRIGSDIYFVACGQVLKYWTDLAAAAGYDCYTVYNLFWRWTDHVAAVPGTAPVSYAQLAANYEAEIPWFIANLTIDLCVPLTAGWDCRPWPPGALIGVGTPAELLPHFQAGKALMLSSPKCIGTVTYAWNECGEGAWMQPDKVLGREKLLQYRKVFKG